MQELGDCCRDGLSAEEEALEEEVAQQDEHEGQDRAAEDQSGVFSSPQLDVPREHRGLPEVFFHVHQTVPNRLQEVVLSVERVED